MKFLSYLTIVLAISLCIVPVAQSLDMIGMTDQEQITTVPLTMVSGTVKEVQGDWCIVEDSQGTEWRIQVDKYTDKIGHVLPGVMISAKVEADGHAKEVKVMPNS
ncbi:MAG: hypothetical protein R3B74_06945 [Nitrospirales bacterium]|nr:hypothetical protein [Nitrospirales bacterium]